MAYIGNQPTVGNFVKLDAITTSATATFNLTNGGVAYSPQSANHCIVSLNGVIQEPTTASNVGGFTVSGSTIVFTSALTSADVIDFILVLGDVLNIGTPSDGTVGFAKVTSNLITGATAETSIAGGDSILIYDDSATALRKMTRTNFIGGGNTPIFKASKSSAQSFASSTETKIQFNIENIDTASAYDNATNYRFTVPSGQGGKYFVSGSMNIQESGSVANFIIYIKKNGSTYLLAGKQGGDANYPITSANGIVELVATDYIEAFLYHEFGTSLDNGSNAYINFFSAYKLIE